MDAEQGLTIIGAVIAFNVALSGLSKGLELIKDKTKSDLDNKIYNILNISTSFIQKIIDWVSANREKK